MSALTGYGDLIGKPFEYGGRGPDSFDCYGLVMECFRRFRQIELPEFTSTANPYANARTMQGEHEKGLWEALSGPRIGSVVLLRVQGFGGHVGFQHRRGRFLHTLERNGVHEALIATHRNQILGFYDHVG